MRRREGEEADQVEQSEADKREKGGEKETGEVTRGSAAGRQ